MTDEEYKKLKGIAKRLGIILAIFFVPYWVIQVLRSFDVNMPTPEHANSNDTTLIVIGDWAIGILVCVGGFVVIGTIVILIRWIIHGKGPF